MKRLGLKQKCINIATASDKHDQLGLPKNATELFASKKRRFQVYVLEALRDLYATNKSVRQHVPLVVDSGILPPRKCQLDEIDFPKSSQIPEEVRR